MPHRRSPGATPPARYRGAPIIIGLTLILGVLAAPAQATGSGGGWPGPPAGPADWPQAMRGPHHQGVNRVETAITRETVGHLAVAWRTPGGSRSPSVVGNAIFLGGDDVQARSVETGAVLWRTDIGFPVWYTPAYGHGIIVAVAYRYDRGDDVIGLDASTGALLWTRPLHGKVSAAPSISGGTVYIGYNKDAGNGVAALRLRSGGIRWRWTSPDLN